MRKYILFLLALLLLMSCRQALVQQTTSYQDTLDEEVRLIPFDRSNEIFGDLRYPEEVIRFYESRGYKPYWLPKDIPASPADSLVSFLRSSRRYGLLPQHYHTQEISELASYTTPVDLARLDVLLTDAFLAISRDLKNGRVRRGNVSKEDSLQVSFLTDTLNAGAIRSFLNEREPRYREYSLLKEALNNILDTVDISNRRMLLAGRTIDSIEVHRKFQCIEINMERWRNENADLDHIYTWVNIPSYMFYVVENHNVILESAVVVGAPSTPTLTFSSNIECFTIFPYWYMPRKIAVREYLPVIKRDTSFLSRNNFDVLDRQGKIQNPKNIEWRKYNDDNFPFTLRQREGKENSLGIIKFVFDNPYAIFVHDTNAKRLFKHQVRAYSHGCIRLEKAIEFAHYLIGGNRSAVSSRMLNKFLGEQKRQTITLNQPIPIYIRYLTSEVKNGQLLFYSDIYKKDVNLVNIIYDQETFVRMP